MGLSAVKKNRLLAEPLWRPYRYDKLSSVTAVPINDQEPPHYIVVASIRQGRLTHRARAFRDFCLQRQDYPEPS